MTRFEYLKRFYDIDESDYQLLTRALKKRSFRKGDYLTIPGQVQRELYFVNRGVQMSYFDADRKMHVIAFTYPPDFCAIPESFSFQKPSAYYLYCLTDSDMEYIAYPELERLFDQSQTLERLFRKATEAVLAGLINRHIELHATTIEERFISFCQRSRHLLQLVPHKYIASYLGIDPTNFSKLYNNVRI